MSDMNRSSYAIIPSYILEDENLDEGAKILYGRISMYSQDGRCWASNKHFSDKHGVDTRTIQRWLTQLKDAGYISVDVDCSGFQTTRDIWIINDFKKHSTKRHICHPPLKSMSPPPATNVVSSNKINTSEINKQQQGVSPPSAAAPSEKEKQQQQPRIHQSLERIEIPAHDKAEITSKYPEQVVQDAVGWATHTLNPPTKCLAASIKFACSHSLSASEFDKKKATPFEILSKMFKHGEFYNGAECYLNSEGIAFSRGMKYARVPINEFFSIDKVDKMCKDFSFVMPKII